MRIMANWVMLWCFIAIVLVALILFAIFYFRPKVQETYHSVSNAELQQFSGSETGTVIRYILNAKKEFLIGRLNVWMTSQFASDTISITDHAVVNGVSTLTVSDLTLYHCDTQGQCPQTTRLTLQDQKLSVVVLMELSLAPLSVTFVIYDSFPYPCRVSDARFVMRFVGEYNCTQNEFQITTGQIIGVTAFDFAFENGNVQNMAFTILQQQPWNIVTLANMILSPLMTWPVTIPDFLDKPWLQSMICTKTDIPIAESYTASQRPLLFTTQTLDYKGLITSTVTELVAMVNSYYRIHGFSIRDPLKECTAVASRCPLDMLNACCADQTLPQLFLGCLDGTQVHQKDTDISICKIDNIEFSVMDTQMLYADTYIDVTVQLSLSFDLWVYIKLSGSTQGECIAFLTLTLRVDCSSTTEAGLVAFRGRTTVQIQIRFPYKVEGRQTVLDTLNPDSIQLRLIDSQDVVYGYADKAGDCLVSCMLAAPASTKQKINDTVYSNIESRLRSLVIDKLTQTFASPIMLPVYLLPQQIGGQFVVYQNFYNFIQSQSTAAYLDLRECQNALPSIEVDVPDANTFVCKTKRQGTGCAVLPSTDPYSQRTVAIPVPSSTEGEPTLLYESPVVTEKCRAYFDQNNEHLHWNISCGGNNPNPFPYVENTIDIDPCISKNLYITLNELNLATFQCLPDPWNPIQPIPDVRNVRYFMVESSLKGRNGRCFTGSIFNGIIISDTMASVLYFTAPWWGQPPFGFFNGCYVTTSNVLMSNPFYNPPSDPFRVNLIGNDPFSGTTEFQVLPGYSDSVHTLFMVFADVQDPTTNPVLRCADPVSSIPYTFPGSPRFLPFPINIRQFHLYTVQADDCNSFVDATLQDDGVTVVIDFLLVTDSNIRYDIRCSASARILSSSSIRSSSSIMVKEYHFKADLTGNEYQFTFTYEYDGSQQRVTIVRTLYPPGGIYADEAFIIFFNALDTQTADLCTGMYVYGV